VMGRDDTVFSMGPLAIALGIFLSSCAATNVRACGDIAYPEAAEREGVEGDVVLRLALDSTGNITEAAVIESADHRLDQAAFDALHSPACRFSPAIAPDGRPIDYVIER